MRILLAGGGTAGHTSPLLATADALRRLEPDCEITCLGTPKGLENRVVPEAGYPLELVPPVPLPRKVSGDLFRVPGPAARRGQGDDARSSTGCGRTWSSATAATSRCRPTSPPAGAKLPIVVHEQNALPGLANKAGARVAARVAVSFPDTRLPKAEYVGLPIRRMISMLDRDALRAEAREFFGLDPDRPTLVVTGGSQGARRLNESVSAAAEALGAAGVQVLHVVGPNGTATPRPTTAPLRRRAVRRPDGLRARRRRPDGLPGRCLQRHRGRRGRRAGDLRAAADRQRRAGAQRPAGRRRRGSAAGRRRGVHARVGRREHVPGAGHRPGAAGRDGRGGVRR